MKIYLFKLFKLLVSALSLLGCSHLSGDGSLKLSVQVIKVDSWLNLMPGGPGSFHFSGNFVVKNLGKCKVDSLSLNKVSVIQNNNELYSIIPVFKSKTDGDNHELDREGEKEFDFYTSSGLTIKKELDASLPIKLILMLTDSNSVFAYEVENIKIEKVY